MTTLVEVGLSNAVAALALAAVAILAGLFRLRPAVVHALWLLVLIKLVTPPLVRIPVPVPVPAPTAGQPAPAESLVVPAEEPVAEPEPAEPEPAERDVIALPPLREERVVLAVDDEGGDLALAAAPAAPPFPWSMTLGAVWLGGSVVWFGLAAYRLWRFGRLLRAGRSAPAGLLKRVARLARRVELAAPPEVRVLPGRLAPMVWGAGKPLLLLPESLEEQVGLDGLDTLLLHELSHLKRGDHLVRWLEFLALGLYWWLPVAWYARRELREAEEQCCDAWVVRTMPGARKLYATALVDALDFLSQPVTAPPPLASALGQVADLKRRLTMIMRGTTPHLLGRPFGLAVFGLALAVLPLVPGLGLGQQAASEEEQQERKDVIRLVDEDQRKLQEEIRRKKEEIEALARKMELLARERADQAAKKAKELGDKISKEVILKLADRNKKQAGNVLRIEIGGESMKPEDIEKLTKMLKEALPGKKINITRESGQNVRSRAIIADADREGHRWEFKVQPPAPPKAPKAPEAPKETRRTPEGRPAEGERRLDNLERRLEGILKELESLRKEMRGPARRGASGGFGQGFGEGGFGGGFGPVREAGSKDAAPRPRVRERSPDQAK